MKKETPRASPGRKLFYVLRESSLEHSYFKLELPKDGVGEIVVVTRYFDKGPKSPKIVIFKTFAILKI